MYYIYYIMNHNNAEYVKEIKQGGVLSPILFTVYLDSLIKTLKQRNIGCKIGNKFLGVFGYADDLTLLCPTLSGLQEMLNVCEDFAKDYNILFNPSKSKLMYFGKNNLNCENLLCMSNGSSIEFVEQCVHLGTKIYSDISKKNIDNATNDLYMRTNNLMADFSYAQSSTLSVLYNSYCMNVYGSQLWCFNDYKSVERFYIAWRKTIRRIWRLDKRTHNVLINLINRCLPINLILEKNVLSIYGIFSIVHMNCIKLLLGTVFIIRDLLWQRILDILCISMILLLMTGISLLTMLLKKSMHMTMTVLIVMIHVLQMLLESYVMIEILIIIQ